MWRVKAFKQLPLTASQTLTELLSSQLFHLGYRLQRRRWCRIRGCASTSLDSCLWSHPKSWQICRRPLTRCVFHLGCRPPIPQNRCDRSNSSHNCPWPHPRSSRVCPCSGPVCITVCFVYSTICTTLLMKTKPWTHSTCCKDSALLYICHCCSEKCSYNKMKEIPFEVSTFFKSPMFFMSWRICRATFLHNNWICTFSKLLACSSQFSLWHSVAIRSGFIIITKRFTHLLLPCSSCRPEKAFELKELTKHKLACHRRHCN